jgi:hypothetical protein
MLQRTNHLFIGKDIARDTHLCADGATIVAFSKTTGIADGEVLVLDKNKDILAAGSTVADTDIIYICQGTADTYSFTDEAGTTVTTVRKVRVSSPIEGKKVKKYTAKSYTVKAERTAAVTLTGMTTPTTGKEYIVRIIYKDMVEHPGQFTQTYRVVATAAESTIALLIDAIVAKINKHTGRRVLATDDTTGITLTGLEKPECTTGLTDLDRFDMVDFDVRFLKVNTDGNWEVIDSTSKTITYTGPTYGSGNWEQVRDMEKDAWGYRGITNPNAQFAKLPAQETVVDAYYDLISIEHDRSYLSPDNQYVKQAPLTTTIALATASTGINANNQAQNILDRLNPWMESLGFDSVTI